MRLGSLSPEAQQLIRTARQEEAKPTGEARQQLRRRLLARIARAAPSGLLGAKVLSVSTPVAAALPAWVVPLKAASLVISGVLIGVAASKGVELLSVSYNASGARLTSNVAAKSAQVSHVRPSDGPRRQAPPFAETKAMAFDSAREPVAQTSAATTPGRSQLQAFERPHETRVVADAEAPPAVFAGKAASDGPQLRQELDLLQKLHRAVQAGEGQRALELIQEYDTRFAAGQLAGERLAAEVFAACLVGDTQRAGRARELFLSRDTVSPLAVRVNGASCFADSSRVKGDPKTK